MNYRIIRVEGKMAASSKTAAEGKTRIRRAVELQADEQAAAIIAAAGQEAKMLLQQAKIEAETVRREAEQIGAAQAAAQLVRLQERLEQEARRMEEDATMLAVRIAEKIIGQQLTLHPETICSVVAQCLKTAHGGRHLTIIIHPDDEPLVQKAVPRLATGLSGVSLEVKSDQQMARGDCIVQSEFGQVDGRIATQLQTMLEALTRE
jgi:type III secretion system HrpE/YscL family protein